MSAQHFQRFHIRRNELVQRQERCKPLLDEIRQLEFDYQPVCDVCQSEQRTIIASQDRYGMDLRLALCQRCGLIYQVDRMTQPTFELFYEKYYRTLGKLYTGEPLSDTYIPSYLESAQQSYASHLLKLIKNQVHLDEHSSILDVGGNIGLIAKRFQEAFGCHSVVIDPAAPEIEIEKRNGLEAYVTTLEAWDTSQTFDFMMILRSIEHVYDLQIVFDKVRQLLKPDGLLYVDFVDPVALTRFVGPISVVAQLDHKFWLTLPTASIVFQALGYEITHAHFSANYTGMGVFLRPIETPPTIPTDYPDKLESVLLQIQHNYIDWDIESSRPNSLQWLRAEARRLRAAFRNR